MNLLSEHINELRTAEAFTRQSFVFDQEFGNDTIIRYKRKRVREHVLKFSHPGEKILELNCGTGEDAMFFSQQGFNVHATDISTGMLSKMKEKILGSQLAITNECCSYTELAFLQNRGPYNLIFSNFGGLNCTGELKQVLESFDALLLPGGRVTLVIISRFCLWETLLLFKGKIKTAFRRFFSNRGRKARVEGRDFSCWYYSPSMVIKAMKNYEPVSIEGLCIFVPPSYIRGFAEKHSGLFRFLVKIEQKLKSSWPWRNAGDYFIITLKKKIS
jgi:ubiquinone/menaquinone biosynthesis C-methylase UbiE